LLLVAAAGLICSHFPLSIRIVSSFYYQTFSRFGQLLFFKQGLESVLKSEKCWRLSRIFDAEATISGQN